MITELEAICDTLLDKMKWADTHGLWNMLTFFGISSFGVLWFRSRKRVEWFSLHLSYQIGRADHKYPNVLFFLARNLNDSPIIISRPNFRFSKILEASVNAHGNTATGDYEIKFRRLDQNNIVEEGYSYSTILIRHRESYLAYIPIQDDLDQQGFTELMSRKRFFGLLSPVLGHISFDLVEIGGRKPKVFSMKFPIRNLVQETHQYTTGISR